MRDTPECRLVVEPIRQSRRHPPTRSVRPEDFERGVTRTRLGMTERARPAGLADGFGLGVALPLPRYCTSRSGFTPHSWFPRSSQSGRIRHAILCEEFPLFTCRAQSTRPERGCQPRRTRSPRHRPVLLGATCSLRCLGGRDDVRQFSRGRHAEGYTAQGLSATIVTEPSPRSAHWQKGTSTLVSGPPERLTVLAYALQ
jgi:hypothetical protein